MRKLLIAGAIASLSISTAPVAIAQDSDALTADSVLAVVNGTEITLGHVVQLRTKLPEQYLTAPDDMLFNGILEQLIDQTLLGTMIGKDTKAITLALENERRAIRAGIVVDGLIAGGVSNTELRVEYDKVVATASVQPEFNASHILVASEEEALAVVAELEAGADFAEVAKAKSTGPSGPRGGELGWFGVGSMVPPFEAAVMALEIGQTSAPVETQFGWHVVKLNDQRDSQPPAYDDVVGEIRQSLQQQKLEKALADLRESVEIETMIEGFDPSQIRNLGLLQ